METLTMLVAALEKVILQKAQAKWNESDCNHWIDSDVQDDEQGRRIIAETREEVIDNLVKSL